MVKFSLNGNMLKIIAMITMLIDHIGVIFFPNITILRIIGRISFPIYSYLIVEGCKYTHDRKKYFLQMFILGIVFSTVFMVVQHELYLCVLVTFSFSIMLIYLIDYVKKNPKTRLILLIITMLTIWIFNQHFEFDYGFVGVLVPVGSYLSDNKHTKILLFSVLLIFLSISMGYQFQMYCLLSIPFIILYDGTRGSLNLKWFFYLFYPVHLVILYFISMILNVSV